MARLNVEASLVSYLNSEGFACYADVPASPPTRYCTVDRTGGSHEQCIDVATITVDCIAESRYQASELALAVDAAMPGFVASWGIRRVDKQSIQNLSHIIGGMEGLYRCVYSILSIDLPD